MKRIVLHEDERVGRWMLARMGRSYFPGGVVCVGLEEDGELIAGIGYEDYTGSSICMHVASDGNKRWLSRSFLRFLFSYPFHQLKVKKVIALVPSGNDASLKLVRGLGFHVEHELIDGHPDGALIILSMTPETCKWIERKAENEPGKILATAVA